MPERSVLLTRPAGENAALMNLLASSGIDVHERPLISLVALDIPPQTKNLAINLDQQDILVFVSKAAVKFGMGLIDGYWPDLPGRLKVVAVGPGTAQALRRLGVKAEFPEVAGSEGLLALRALREVRGRKVMIARGEGGRELLADSLRARGADVTYFETYRRQLEQVQDIGECLKANQPIAVLTSGEILRHFTGLARAQAVDLARVVAVVPSGRVGQLAVDYGFKEVINAGGASGQSLYDAIMAIQE